MSGFTDKLKVTKSEGMSGIGADQSALFRDGDPNSSTDPGEQQQNAVENQTRSMGGSGLDHSSTIEPHKSNLLNKLDPRIGMSDEQRSAHLDKYEAKYGTVEPNEADGSSQGGIWDGTRGQTMSGMGVDQSALHKGQTEL